MAIRAGLNGDDYDLHFLSEHFPMTDGRGVVTREDRYWLVFPPPSEAADDITCWQVAATRLLDRINDIASSLNSTYRHATVTEHYVDDISGKSNKIFTASVNDRVHFSSTVTAIAEPPGPPSPPRVPEGTRRFQLAISNPEVDKALHLFGNPNGPDWVDLYKIYEIIRDHVGGALHKQPWGVSAKEIDRFTHTANYEQRHATRKVKRPKSPMPLHDTQSLIRRLIDGWLREP